MENQKINFIKVIDSKDNSLLEIAKSQKIQKKILFKGIKYLIKKLPFDKFDLDIFKIILEKLKNNNIVIHNKKYIWFVWIERKEYDALEYVLENGANINITLNNKNAWDSYFKINEDIRLLKILLKYKIDLYLLNKKGDSPLMTSINKNFVKTFDLLLIFYKNNLNHQNIEGNTAVHFSVKSEYNYYFQKLLENNANICIKNFNNQLPIDITKNKLIIKTLIIEKSLYKNNSYYSKLLNLNFNEFSSNIKDNFNFYFSNIISTITNVKTKLQKRNKDLIKYIKNKIWNVNENIELCIFGSFPTDLNLPNSDIDICLKNVNEEEGFWKNLETIFLKFKFNCKLVLDTKVPIWKLFSENYFNYTQIDISIHKNDIKLNSVQLINDYLNSYAYLKEIILFFKDILNKFNLNCSYKGGLNSYSIILIIISFIQINEYNTKLDYNKAKFEFFVDFILFIKGFDNNSYLLKPNRLKIFNSNPLVLKSEYEVSDTILLDKIIIIDPLDNKNNVSKSCYKFDSIKIFFNNIFSSYFN